MREILQFFETHRDLDEIARLVFPASTEVSCHRRKQFEVNGFGTHTERLQPPQIRKGLGGTTAKHDTCEFEYFTGTRSERAGEIVATIAFGDGAMREDQARDDLAFDCFEQSGVLALGSAIRQRISHRPTSPIKSDLLIALKKALRDDFRVPVEGVMNPSLNPDVAAEWHIYPPARYLSINLDVNLD